MKVIIIEDDPLKINAINDFLKTHEVKTELYNSYQAGLLAILKNQYDLVLLDMQLPNFDIKSGEDGYKLRPLAGRDILREIKRKKLPCKVVVVTQFDTFGDNGKFVSLDDWHKYFTNEFSSIYLSTIFYNPSSNSWKDQLKQYLIF